VTSRPNREQAHGVLLSRRLAGKSGASPTGPRGPDRQPNPAWQLDSALQLNVPCSITTGADPGADIMPPPSPHEPHAGPQAGASMGAPQAG